MRFNGLALIASAIVFSACGGADAPQDTPQTVTPAADAPAATAMPITGTTHVVNMILDDAGAYRYDPANITVRTGDGIRFVMVSGAPHNVAFNRGDIPEAVRPQLIANMPNQMLELSSPMFMNAGEEYTISFAGIPAGQYPYHCTPHLAMDMRGVITVQD